MFGVHSTYDFAAFSLPWSAPVSASVAAVSDLAPADLDPRFLHPDLALLPITPRHYRVIMAATGSWVECPD
jgi:hypothetical protein